MSRHNGAQLLSIIENFGSIWPVHVSSFTQLLIQLRAQFDNDLDLLLVMATIGDRTKPEAWAPALANYGQLTQVASPPSQPFPINIQSIADYTRIPRETVRRKVGVLEAKGYVSRDAKGHISVTREASPLLSEATEATVNYLTAILAAYDGARER